MNSGQLWRELDLGSLLMQPELIHHQQAKGANLNHERQWMKPQYAVIKERYGNIPHLPKTFKPDTYDRLSDPIKGKYSRYNEYKSQDEENYKPKGGFFLTGNDDDHQNDEDDEDDRRGRYQEEDEDDVDNESTDIVHQYNGHQHPNKQSYQPPPIPMISKFSKRLQEATVFSQKFPNLASLQQSNKGSKQSQQQRQTKANNNQKSWKSKFIQQYDTANQSKKQNKKFGKYDQPPPQMPVKSRARYNYHDPSTDVKLDKIRSSGYGGKITGKTPKGIGSKAPSYIPVVKSTVAKKPQPISYNDLLREVHSNVVSTIKDTKPIISKSNRKMKASKSAPELRRRQLDPLPVPQPTAAVAVSIADIYRNKQKLLREQKIVKPVMSSSKLQSKQSLNKNKMTEASKELLSQITIPERTTQDMLQTIKQLETKDTSNAGLDKMDVQLTTQLSKYLERIDKQLSSAQMHSQSYKAAMTEGMNDVNNTTDESQPHQESYQYNASLEFE